jgi:dinuclear metal center YbgI/SA1388 family protein
MNNLLLEQLVNDLLEVNLFQDYCPNGLQIEGVSEIKKIATAVTASQAIIKQAIDKNVDALFVHHGYFWKGENPCIRGVKKERIALLIQNKMNLFAYHLPLDVYIDFGNNASISHKLHLINLVQHASGLLWIGDTKGGMSSQELFLLAQKHYGPQVQYIGPELKNIQKIAFCSGGGQNYFEEAIIRGADVFLSGEYSEKVFHLAHESGVGFLVLGHHASEKDGIQNLGKYLSQKFNLEHIFLDEKNPL